MHKCMPWGLLDRLGSSRNQSTCSRWGHRDLFPRWSMCQTLYDDWLDWLGLSFDRLAFGITTFRGINVCPTEGKNPSHQKFNAFQRMMVTSTPCRPPTWSPTAMPTSISLLHICGFVVEPLFRSFHYEKWPNLVAKKVCACFFAVESFFPPYLNLCLFSPSTSALCNGLSYAIEVFDDEESNERLTIWTFLSEHIKTASETPRYLQFLVVFDHFPHEIANGQTFIRFLVLFWVSLVWGVWWCA